MKTLRFKTNTVRVRDSIIKEDSKWLWDMTFLMWEDEKTPTNPKRYLKIFMRCNHE